MEAITIRLEDIAIRLEAIAIRLEDIAIRLEAIAIRVEAIASKLEFVVLSIFVLYASWLQFRHDEDKLLRSSGKACSPGSKYFLIRTD